MQSKLKLIPWLLAAAFLTGLLVISIFVKLMGSEDLLLVTPDISNSSQISAEELEQINGESFLLTYEILTKESVQALNANYDVIVRKTNSTYPHIINKKLLNGSFFTEKDQMEKKKFAILNKTAAYAMFGNVNLCGSKIVISQNQFTIVGVIEDGLNEEKNVYIPAACSGENPSFFIVQLEGDLTEAQIKNECKSIAAVESGYRYISFGTLVDLVYGMSFIGLKLAVISILLFSLKKSYCRLRVGIKNIRDLSESFYMREILRYHPIDVLKGALVCISMVLMTIIILNLIFSFIEYFLIWTDSVSMFQLSSTSVFNQIALSLKINIYLSLFFLTGLFINMVLLLFVGSGKFFT